MRLGRGYFWLIVGAYILFLKVTAPAFKPLWQTLAAYGQGLWALAIIVFVMLLPIAIAGVGRLHDIGKPGWPSVFTVLFIATLPYWFVLGSGAFISSFALLGGNPVMFDAAKVGPMPALVCSPILLAATFTSGRTIVRWLQPSDRGDNQYGTFFRGRRADLIASEILESDATISARSNAKPVDAQGGMTHTPRSFGRRNV